MKRKISNRIISIVLTVLIVLSIVPVGMIGASAGGYNVQNYCKVSSINQKVNWLLTNLPAGGFFTTTGTNCCYHNGSECGARHVSCYGVANDRFKLNWKEVNGGATCWGFVQFVVGFIYGEFPRGSLASRDAYYSNCWGGTNEITQMRVGSSNEASLESIIKNNAYRMYPGCMLLSSNNHYVIYMGHDANGVWVYDANWRHKNLDRTSNNEVSIINLNYVNYGELKNRCGGGTVSVYGLSDRVMKKMNVASTIIVPNNAPSNLTISGTGMENGKIATGKQVKLSWSAVSNADSYNISVNGKYYTNVSGTSCYYTLPADGIHTFTVTAKNSAGVSSKYSTVSCEAMPKVKVSFYASDGKTLIESKYTDYNTSVAAPSDVPTIEHYDFTGWSKSLDNIKEDTAVCAKYEKKTYKVRFFAYDENGTAVQKGSTQKVKYLESASEPSEYATWVREGMTFAGWSKDFSSVTDNTDVYLVEKWYNQNMKVKIQSGATAVRDADGYTVSCTLKNNYTSTTVGRIIVTIKTSEQKLIYTTESSAFKMTSGGTKSMEVYVPCDEAGTIAEIYAVENFSTALPISETVKITIDQGNAYSNWSTEKAPSNASSVESKTQYKYRTKSYIKSGYSYVNGYTQSAKTLISTSYGSWYPWSLSASTSSDSNYSYETTIQETTAYRYNSYYNSANRAYYWYTAGGVYNPRYISVWTNTSKGAEGYDNGYGYFNMGKSVTVNSNCNAGTVYCIYTWGVSGGKVVDPSTCLNSYTTGASSGQMPLYLGGQSNVRRTVTNKYQYTHWKWNDWSDWSDTAVSSNNEREVQTQTLYRYKTNEISGQENTDGVLRTITGKVSADFAGREADLFIYKYDEASDWTNEYIGQCTIGSDGTYTYTFKLRDEPTIQTGDFTATLGIEGTSAVFDISDNYDWLKAPIPKYSVTYYDADGSVLSTQSVAEGSNAQVPDVIPQKEGYTFVGWDNSNMNIQSEINISPKFEINEYDVVFVNWEEKTVDIKKFKYGEELVLPEITNNYESYLVKWDTSELEDHFVKSNMVITTVNELKSFKVEFYGINNEVISTQSVDYGGMANVPELSIPDKCNFDNWSTSEYSYVTSDLQIYPVYHWDETVTTPVASTDTGTYSENFTVSLSTDTEGAKIYYSTDGSDPAKGTEYTKPIVISGSTELSFVAVKENCNNSDTVKKYYALNKANMTSEWMTQDELPDYVVKNPSLYEVYDDTGYKYKDTVTLTSLAQVKEYESNGWVTSSSEWSDYSEYSTEYPNCPDNEISIDSKDADLVEKTFYNYSHYKYYDSESEKYIFTSSPVEGTTGETETLKLETKLSVNAISPEKNYLYNNELWFNYSSSDEMVDPGYDLYRYKVKEFTLYKWTGWDNASLKENETREYISGDIYQYTIPKEYIITLSYENSSLDDIPENKLYLVKETEKLPINNDDFETEGYSFDGIYKDSDLSDEWNIADDCVNENKTLYVKYSQKTFNVRFLDYDGSVINSQKVVYLNNAIVPENPVREGYVFTGWKNYSDGVTEDIDYVAEYISEDEYVKVSLSRSKISMMSGSTFNISVSVTPDEKINSEVIWYSSNTSIATVDSEGKITAVHSGTAIITVVSLESYESSNCVVNVLGSADAEILPISSSQLKVDASAKYLIGVEAGSNTIKSLNEQLENTDLKYLDSGNLYFDETKEDTILGTGCHIFLLDGNSLVDSVEIVVNGDVNGDGCVDVLDATSIEKISNGHGELSGAYFRAGDICNDDIIDISDYTQVINKALAQ